ncbi:McrC family protein [Thermococcus pacificus]|uniref:Restriction endonuclease n=1 Tax=Thermococcus pacificus TaxID=71998 RepID=A0A218P9C1_9EURY|nr:hypothetical protein [Thermococcus pacificus]ASJ07384.1 hypothetical protein A3L08_08665 [Thermococcus pacificus]
MTVVDLFEFTPINYTTGKKAEFDEDSKTLVLLENQLSKLEKLNEEIKFLEIGRKTIKPRNFVGVVQIDDLTLQIFPKLLRTSSYDDLESHKTLIMGNLLKMLAVGGEIPVKPSEVAGVLSEKAPFLEILISIYSQKLLETLRYHRHYTYRRVEEELNHVKGQIDFGAYASRWHRRHVIPVRYNDRTMDSLLNRTLKYGAYLMARLTQSHENYLRLRSAMEILDGVPLVPVSVYETYRIHFNRLNAVFKPLVEIARMFISGTTLRLQTGRIETFTFLVPMEKVFESFVAGLITNSEYEALPKEFEGSIIKTQHHIGNLLAEGKFWLIPDITIQTTDGMKIIIDTKYKLLDKEDQKLGVSQSDLYQMYAYASHWNADAVVLLYPSISSVINRKWHFNIKTKGTEKKVPLLIKSLDLGSNFLDEGEWEKFLEEFRNLMGEILGEKRQQLEYGEQEALVNV